MDDLTLRGTPLAIGAVELRCDRRCALLVGSQHQLHTRVRSVEPTGGVDARPQPEGQIALVEPPEWHLGRRAQGAETRASPAAGGRKPLPNKRPHLAPTRNETDDSSQ